MQLLYASMRLLGKAMLVSLIVWSVVQPLVAARFNLVTPSAIVLGPLLAIPVTVAMAAGFAVMLFGWLLPPLGLVCGFVCDRALAVVVSTVEATRNAPGGKFWTPGPADWWLAGFYFVLISWAVVPRVRQLPRRWLATFGLGWFAIGLAAAYLPFAESRTLRATFLSVGHGLAVVIELPDGKCLLYDAGSMAAPEFAAKAVSGYLFSRGIRTIDLLIISHADADHYNAVPRLLRQFRVREIGYGPQMFRDEVEPILHLQAALAEAALKLRQLSAGDVIFDGKSYRLEVLHPPSTAVTGSDNSESVVVKLTCAGRSMLLTGDLESPGLEMVLDRPIAPIDVLLAPHHGSGRSDPPGFARWAAAKNVVISGSFRDRSASVRAAYESQGAHVYHTAEHGAIEAKWSPADCTVTVFRDNSSRASQTAE
jgi:competence protein ComEC